MESTITSKGQVTIPKAMIALKQRRGSFADALIGALGIAARCAHTVTFEREALRLAGFELL